MHIKTETVVGLFILTALAAFFYMTFHIGLFRFDKNRYIPYNAYFNDISGLTKKADVKIAGVKVGWIENIDLVNQEPQVHTKLMILRDYILHTDARAMVRQDGFFGGKFVEIGPGDPSAPKLGPDGVITRSSQDTSSVDDILSSFKKVADTIEEVSSSIKNSLAPSANSMSMQDMVTCCGQAVQRIAQASAILERLLVSNEERIGVIASDMQHLVVNLKEQLPILTQIAQQLHSDFLPSVANSASQLAESFSTSTQSFQEITSQAQASLKHISDIAQKINEGQGAIGKLINEDDTYTDLRSAVRGVRGALDKIERVAIVMDGHTETMQNLAEERFSFQDTKAYTNARIYPSEDYFYIVGLAFSQKGYIWRKANQFRYFDEKNNELLPSELRKENQLFNLVARKETTHELRDSLQPNLQIGKIFKNIALRVGLFEGSFGAAVDFCLPFANDQFKWITTLEAWDFRGRNRFFDDTRPHVKWLNRLFVTQNIYLTFGADDFLSKYNKNAFFGAGLRFEDNDLKYVLPYALGCCR